MTRLSNHLMRCVAVIALFASAICAVAAERRAPMQLPAFVPSEEEIIDVQPAGNSVYYYRHVFSTIFDGENLDKFWDHGYLSEIIDDGDIVYIRDPFTFMPTNTYIKGYRDGDDLIFPMPQPVYSEYEGGQLYIWEARLMTPEDWDGITDEPSSEDLILTIDQNNNIVQREGNGTLGLFIGDRWTGVADEQYTFSVFTDKVNTMPDTNYEIWNLIANGYVSDVYVAFVGDKVYLGNFYSYIDGSSIVGTLKKDGKIYFEPKQFLGVDFTFNYFTYFMPARKVGNSGSYTDYEFIDGPLVFTYDPEKKEMRAEDSYLINSGKEEMAYIDNFDAPIIRADKGAGDKAAPMDPVITKFVQFNPSWGFGAVYFDLPKMDVNGNVLDPEFMAYNVYYDGVLHTFKMEDTQLLLQDYTNIPYLLNNYFDIQGGEEERHCIFFKQTLENFGVQTIYGEDYDESTWLRSNIVWYPSEPVSVGSFAADTNAVATEYYDFAGRRIDSADGATIIVNVYADGSRKATKNFIRRK